jgi:hypothetical protein
MSGRLFFFKPDIKNPGGSKKKTGQTLIRIVRERADYEKITAIEFKQKWIMPWCSPTHLVSD